MKPEMDVPVPVTRGVRELLRLLREHTFDLRGLDLAGFRRWLDGHLARWQNDPVFVQRTRIRDLRRAHPDLHALEEEHRRATRAEAASPQSPRLRRLEQELLDTGKAVAGLTAAQERATPERRPTLQQKLDDFQEKRRALQEEQARLIASSPPRQTLLRVNGEVQRLRSAVGLDREEARLDALRRRHGRHSGRAGASFEEVARALAWGSIVPDLLRGNRRDGAVQRLRVLPGVTLGAARTEFDQLVIRLPLHGGRPVEVLAVVEVKRNLNDLAHGFRRRQEDLAWLTGAAGRYDPALFRTRHFRSGHFDRAAVHEHEGETFLFTRQSFRRFRRDPATDLILDRLYFVTRTATLWGVPTAALARIGFRVATDERFEPDSDSYLRRLWRWCQALAGPVETPDVLRMYSSTPKRGRQVLLVGR
jgi:hypothetical protein